MSHFFYCCRWWFSYGYTSKTEEMLTKFNSLHPKIQFTMKIGGQETNKGFQVDILILSILSHKKEAWLLDLLTGSFFLLSYPEFHLEHEWILNMQNLLDNNYPLRVVFNTIFNRIKQLINEKSIVQTNNSIEKNEKRIMCITIPFIESDSEKFRHIVNGVVLNLSFFDLINCLVSSKCRKMFFSHILIKI